MASHAGLIYTLKTENGYITENKKYTDNINEAIRIRFEWFGFANPQSVLRKLGFSNDEGEFVTIEESYDSRLGTIENYLKLIGYANPNFAYQAENIYTQYNCNKYDNYLECINNLKKEFKIIYNAKKTVDKIIIDDKEIELKEFDENKLNENLEYQAEVLYGDEYKIIKSTYKLKEVPLNKYFSLNLNEKEKYQNNNQKLKEIILNKLKNYIIDIKIINNELIIYSFNSVNNNYLHKSIFKEIRNYYESNQTHITRMFGSYILIKGNNNELKAVKATPIPIKYCPLMVKLLREVGGEVAENLINTLEIEDEELQTQMMCNLINEVVIKGGYFDTNRPLNSCEANVLFGASETMSSAFQNNIIDAAVIVSNNLGTIITTNNNNTQGAVKRMTGLFYTSPSETIINTAEKEGIIPVFPYTAEIDQLAGIKKAIELGYKKIAISVAANDNYLHDELKKLEEENKITIYKFGLCSTGIDEKTANIMKNNADVVWSCASKQVKKYIDPNSIAQVGIKIPVHIMTTQGWEIVKNHLKIMNPEIDYNNIELNKEEEKPVFINSETGIKVLKKKYVNNCSDCPRPCI